MLPTLGPDLSPQLLISIDLFTISTQMSNKQTTVHLVGRVQHNLFCPKSTLPRVTSPISSEEHESLWLLTSKAWSYHKLLFFSHALHSVHQAIDPIGSTSKIHPECNYDSYNLGPSYHHLLPRLLKRPLHPSPCFYPRSLQSVLTTATKWFF